jgi:integrase
MRRRLVAFFGCMYYAALRPAEASELARVDITFPGRTNTGVSSTSIGRPHQSPVHGSTAEGVESRVSSSIAQEKKYAQFPFIRGWWSC